jgi:hypothetical protein
MTYDWNKLLSGERRRRSGAKRIKEIEYHLSLISHPDEITRLILEAAGQPA